MAKKRLSKNKHLPRNWRFKNGAFYYRVPKDHRALWDNKTEFRLGSTEAEAYRVWSERINQEDTVGTVNELFDRYLAEIVPTYAESQRKTKQLAIKRLRPVFGPMPVSTVKPSQMYKYMNIGYNKRGKNTTNKDFETFSHAMTIAIEWGAIDRHPFKGQVVKKKNKPRTRDIQDWEMAEVMSLPVPVGKAARNVELTKLYIRFKYMTALRRVDIINLKLSDIKSDGIHVTPSKTEHSTGVRLILQWDDLGELRSLVEEIKKVAPRRIGDSYLFVTSKGEQFTKNTFDSMWGRFRKRLLASTKLEENFIDSDIRAKNNGDTDDIVEASERAGHSTTATTNRVYRRKPRKVKPLPFK